MDMDKKSNALAMDWEVLVNSTAIENTVALRALRKLRPPRPDVTVMGECLASGIQPWDEASCGATIPTHRFRTFDMSRKLKSTLEEICPQRSADAVLLLRLLFDEHALSTSEDQADDANVGGTDALAAAAATEARSRRGVKTRPLTVGEITENWDVIRDRCIMQWVTEDGIARAGTGDGIDPGEAMLRSIDEVVLECHRHWLETDFASYEQSLQHSALVSLAIREVRRRAQPQSSSQSKSTSQSTSTVFMASNSPLAHESLRWAAERILKGLEGELQDKFRLRDVASVVDIERELNALAVASQRDGDGDGNGAVDGADDSNAAAESTEEAMSEAAPETVPETAPEAGPETGQVAYFGARWQSLSLLAGVRVCACVCL